MNRTNKEIFFNILTAILSMFISTIVLLYVYRIANQSLGIEQIGLWSIVTTLTSFGNLGTFGITGSLVKFSAEFQSKGERQNIVKLLNSFVMIMSILVLIFLFLLYFFALLFLDQIVDVKYLHKAFELLPYSFTIFFLSTIGYLVLSVIEGLNKGWQKHIVVIVSNLALLICMFLWIDKYGIEGIFYSQLAQAVVILGLSIVLLKANFKDYSWSSYNMDWDMLKRVTQYGLKFQSVSIFQMIGEPVTKFFLSRYGGLGFVGVFEMASRLVVQIRSILVTIVSSLLPKLVDIYANHPSDRVNVVFIRVFKINFDLFAIAYGLLFLLSPVIVQIWLGETDSKLVDLIRFFTVVWFINSVTIVPYIFNLGSGKLNGNVISHALIGLCNLLFGVVVILTNYDAVWFIYSWMFSLVIGSGYLLKEYISRSRISYSELFTVEYIIVLLINIINFTLLWFLIEKTSVHKYFIFSLVTINYIVMMSIYTFKSKSFTVIKEYFSSFNLLSTNKYL